MVFLCPQWPRWWIQTKLNTLADAYLLQTWSFKGKKLEFLNLKGISSQLTHSSVWQTALLVLCFFQRNIYQGSFLISWVSSESDKVGVSDSICLIDPTVMT